MGILTLKTSLPLFLVSTYLQHHLFSRCLLLAVPLTCHTQTHAGDLLYFLCLEYSSSRYLYCSIFFSGLFRAAPMKYGSSQARDPVEAVAASLDHSHSNAGSDPSCICNLHHSSRQHQILNPVIKARDRTRILTDTSWIHDAEP